ncbi:hypothetical protein SAMN05892883_2076 [Jatrophihabitans sp. GAS493]|uniref:hypothetical protein n=1 Tax=Jatrophihabitans sp. GAS493 TaxID=1907575 RepID=UPI000BBFE861|nr:hypothetical protein [Jatrophihabitans sp. GAS493]SOD72727.1 hypothetical protein SAMN05892883_2076 [Jatrophihabitans sp. GAS493]
MTAPVTPPAAPTDPQTPPTAPTTPPAAPVTPPATVPPAPTPADVFANWDGKVETLPEAAQRIIRDARKEAGDSRTAKNAEAERVKAILAAAGIDTGDEDPVKALETARAERDQLAAEAKTLRVERALDAAARTHKADAALLTAVLAHNGELTKLDPASATFATELDALVLKAVADNPKLKDTQAASASGIPSSGGPGVPADIEVQIAEATKAGNHRLAIALKRQQAYASQA